MFTLSDDWWCNRQSAMQIPVPKSRQRVGWPTCSTTNLAELDSFTFTGRPISFNQTRKQSPNCRSHNQLALVVAQKRKLSLRLSDATTGSRPRVGVASAEPTSPALAAFFESGSFKPLALFFSLSSSPPLMFQFWPKLQKFSANKSQSLIIVFELAALFWWQNKRG